MVIFSREEKYEFCHSNVTFNVYKLANLKELRTDQQLHAGLYGFP